MLLPVRLVRHESARNAQRDRHWRGQAFAPRSECGGGQDDDESRPPEKLTRHGVRSSAGNIAPSSAASGVTPWTSMSAVPGASGS